jgi:hypothetical protein
MLFEGLTLSPVLYIALPTLNVRCTQRLHHFSCYISTDQRRTRFKCCGDVAGVCALWPRRPGPADRTEYSNSNNDWAIGGSNCLAIVYLFGFTGLPAMWWMDAYPHRLRCVGPNYDVDADSTNCGGSVLSHTTGISRQFFRLCSQSRTLFASWPSSSVATNVPLTRRLRHTLCATTSSFRILDSKDR